MYGHFHGGDPRAFRPDRECCTPEEIAVWEAACAAWNRGEQVEPAVVSGHYVPEPGVVMHISGSSYGIGVYEWDCDGDECPECGT
jgi:hypothetical protein